jgi:hypothetical protein
MLHKSSLLMTGLVLMMAAAWFGMEHFDLGHPDATGMADATDKTAPDAVAAAEPEDDLEHRFQARAAALALDVAAEAVGVEVGAGE